MNKITRGLISSIGILLGLIVIFIVILAKSVVNGIDVESVNEALGYVSILGGSSMGIDIETMLILMKISSYSHLILTIGIIWITLFLYVWINPYKEKVNKP